MRLGILLAGCVCGNGIGGFGCCKFDCDMIGINGCG